MSADPRREQYPHLVPNTTDDREHHRVEVGHGLLEPKHREQLGPAWHLYLNLLRRKPFGTAWVFGGRIITIPLLAWIEAVDERTIHRWLARLRSKGYIHVEVSNTGRPDSTGLRVRILKAKEWRKGRMRTHRDVPEANP